MPDAAHSAPDGAAKISLRQRAVSELEKYAMIGVYLWLLFALFGLHKELILRRPISLWQQGFALINALVFGKVILIGEAVQLGRRIERRALIWVVLGKSLLFSILLLVFHMAEEAIRVSLKSEPLSTALTDVGGSWAGALTYTAIFFVALIPFFAFHEVARVLGSPALWNLFFHTGNQRFRLVQD